MTQDNKIVHGLWIGTELSVVELLCINSFISNGHEFHLWVYDNLSTVLPDAVILGDANTIIPKSEVFAYRNKNQYGHGKGSFAGFSDIFRYKLLFLYGGWWTDMDVVCLRSLDFLEPYVFRTHHDFPVVGNIMKCPKESQLMYECYELAVAQVNADNTDWNLPIRILNEAIVKHELQSCIHEFSNQDSWRYVRTLLYRNPRIPAHWEVLHLVNEEWRRNKIDKDAIPGFSLIGKKLALYGIKTDASRIRVFKNYSRIVFPRSAFIQAYWLFAKVFWRTVRLIKKEKGTSKGQ